MFRNWKKSCGISSSPINSDFANKHVQIAKKRKFRQKNSGNANKIIFSPIKALNTTPTPGSTPAPWANPHFHRSLNRLFWLKLSKNIWKGGQTID
ncbi:hypothetical protein J7E38_08835 [Bacillus sp. ISL-35]|uniref:hypothetical protein n=1 Tax=Bacillus sp. ISL-35 TaxID=2819122 RepID=UPI001BE8BC2D|nr:hypothetical protein [Bacillus sp. ISL-35]MBT2679107.1 hypothetical protein [Bacillus sp. ISL-35]MBT2702810.1 hypothetical protein [Chryseobacterium sp. ISL-80]